MAGIHSGTDADYEPESLKKLMPMFTFAQLDMPLRSTKALLQAAGLNTQNDKKILCVTGMLNSNINFSPPSNLLPGVETEHFYYDSQIPKAQAVQRAREAMVKRMGNCGVGQGGGQCRGLDGCHAGH